MIVLYNPWSTPSPKRPLPMSLLAIGSMLEAEFEYRIVDGNLEADPAGAILAIADKQKITAIAVTGCRSAIARITPAGSASMLPSTMR